MSSTASLARLRWCSASNLCMAASCSSVMVLLRAEGEGYVCLSPQAFPASRPSPLDLFRTGYRSKSRNAAKASLIIDVARGSRLGNNARIYNPACGVPMLFMVIQPCAMAGLHGHSIFLIAATGLSELLIDDGNRQPPSMIGLDRVRQLKQFLLCERSLFLKFHLGCIAMPMAS